MTEKVPSLVGCVPPAPLSNNGFQVAECTGVQTPDMQSAGLLQAQVPHEDSVRYFIQGAQGLAQQVLVEHRASQQDCTCK